MTQAANSIDIDMAASSIKTFIQHVALLCRMKSGELALLLALPDPCLLAVLQYCAEDDRCSLFNAARAHSRLHQAAVLALRSIKAITNRQQQAVCCNTSTSTTSTLTACSSRAG
jgi:hypothetical protein